MISIQTFSGKILDVSKLTPEDIDARDIAMTLAKQCRFAGRITQWYSVAEHSVHVAQLVLRWTNDVSLAAAALFDDAPEAFMIDLPRPIKYMDGMESFRELEKTIGAQISAKWKLPINESKDPNYNVIKRADNTIVSIEKALLLTPCTEISATLQGLVQKRFGLMKMRADASNDPRFMHRAMLSLPCWSFDEAAEEFLVWAEVLLDAHAKAMAPVTTNVLRPRFDPTIKRDNTLSNIRTGPSYH
jgi:hypothetical protein